MPDRPAPAARPEGAPNVILICVDQWRGDCLSVAGHPVVETPYLDQLALRAHSDAVQPARGGLT